MVERPLSMREVPGSTSGFSTSILFTIVIFCFISKQENDCLFQNVFAVYYFVFTIISRTNGPYSLFLVEGAFKAKAF